MTTWLPLSEVAELQAESLTDRALRLRVASGKYGEEGEGWRRTTVGRNGNGYEVSLAALSPAEQSAYFARAGATAIVSIAAPLVVSLEAANNRQREGAAKRKVAVHAYSALLAHYHRQPGITAARERLAADLGVSVDSLVRWHSQYLTHGDAGLVDRNDGSSRRGRTTIPRGALAFFVARWKDRDDPPTIARAIEDTRLEYECGAIGGAACTNPKCRLPHADDPFYRWIEEHVTAAERIARDAVDTPSSFLPYVGRAMEQPYRTLQSDHHIADVFVNCEGTVCGGGLADCRAHRPWITPIYDVGSRKIISHAVSLDVPNSERILRAFFLAVMKEGLPERFYVDNGRDFKKAAERRLTRESTEYLGRRFGTLGIQVVFARPYNAQAKAIERLFGTFVERRWRGTPGYTGRLGKRSERTQSLVAHPEQLPTFTDFCQYLDATIDIHNTSAHRGTGMQGRTPTAVLAAWRATHPRREPDPFAFRLVFWRMVERTLGRVSRGYGVRDQHLVYVLADPDARVAAAYLGSRVKVLIDPEDVAHAIVCSEREEFLCEARVLELATHDTSDAVTQEALEAVKHQAKAFRRRVYAGDRDAIRQLARFKAGYIPRLVAVGRSRRAESERLVAAGGAGDAVSVVIPRYSRIARDAAASTQAVHVPLSFTAEENELAASVTLPSAEELLSLAPFIARPSLVASFAGDDDEPAVPTIQEIEFERQLSAREADGFCTATLDCPFVGDPFCSNHRDERADV
jgi:hypothetical protein